MSQQSNYSQQAMSENSWDLVNKAVAASTLSTASMAAASPYNGYSASAGGLYHRSTTSNTNGNHHGVASQAHNLPMSPNAAGTGTNSSTSNSGMAQQWHGVHLPTALSSNSGTTTAAAAAAAAAEQWLAATNHLQQQHQNLTGMNLSSAMIAPSPNAAAVAQLYSSGNTTSYFPTGGGDAGIARPSPIPLTRPQPTGHVLSPTSPMISPTQSLAATSWSPTPSSRADASSILAKQHHHQLYLPQNHQSSEQRSPQQQHHQVALVHGLNDKASPHFHQQHHQPYPNYPGNAAGSTTPATATASLHEKLLEAVAIQAARVPFLSQQQAQQSPSLHYLNDAVGGNGEHHQNAMPTSVAPTGPSVAHHSSLLELDILRNLAATAGGAGGGHSIPVQHGQGLLSNQQPSNSSFGTNGYSNSSFRPPVNSMVKQEPSYCDVTPPPPTTSVSKPSSELDVAHTMLSIQTCSAPNTVPKYQQISPPASTEASEMKYHPPTSPNSNFSGAQGNSTGRGEDKAAYAAITVEAQGDTDDLANQPSAKRLKTCTSLENESRETESNAGTTTGDNDNNHSDVNAQFEQAKKTCDDEEEEAEDKSPFKEIPSPTLLSDHANGADDASPVVSQSSPSYDTPLSIDGRSGSIGSRSSRSSHSRNESPPGTSATATATVVTVAGNIVLPPTSASSTSGSMVVHPPGLVGPSPFGAFTAQHGNHANLHSCHICGFTSPSKFHFNSHMNTHTDHKCDFCDYTSRTEGRLKRHMKEFHSPPQVSGANSNDESSGHGTYQGGAGSAQFDQSLEEQLQAVVASMTAGTSGGAGAFGGVAAASPSKSGGGGNKSKTYRCKQCDFVAKSKDDHWAHTRGHIKADKLLTCPKCPFVTEYKHHLEYHLRNHFGSKPFKCVKCNYSCVNKSMLNSHMKSHSNFYQYRCADCTYATKYCHSLKLHLRKYAHTPATTVTPDGGTVVDGSAIDVYGNRRGPRGKKGSDSGSRSSGEGGPRSMVSASGPISASLPISSPPHLHHHPTGNGAGVSGFVPGSSLMPPMTLADSLSQHPPTMVGPGPNASAPGPLMPSFVEALQSSLLAQQQKDIAAAMVTSIATLGAQLPTIPSLAAAIAAAQTQPAPSTTPMASIPRPDSSSPGPPSGNGAITPGAVTASAFQLTSPTANLPPAVTPTMKCSLCDFSCASKETLTKHTMIHVMEKPEQLYQVYSLMASAAAQAQAVAAAAAAMATNQQSTSGSSCGSTPVVNDLGTSKSEMGSKLGSSTTPNMFYGSGMLDESNHGRYVTSRDPSQDSGGSPASVSGGKTSGDEGVGGESYMSMSTNAGGQGGHRQRRKGRAFKLDRIALKLQGRNCDDGDTESIAETGNGGDYDSDTANRSMRHTRSTSPATVCGSQLASNHRVNRSESVSSVSGVGRPNLHHITSSESIQNRSTPQPQRHQSPASLAATYPSPMGRPTNIDWSNAYVCNFCEIAFKDCIMYTMHMGFHGYQDPYKCNTCGHISDDPRSMFLHIAREPHL